MKYIQKSLDGLLQQYFRYYRYEDAIENIRKLILNKELTLENWIEIKKNIINREFKNGEPLDLIAVKANLPLDEDTDEEAYKWLDLFVKNIESENKIIIY